MYVAGIISEEDGNVAFFSLTILSTLGDESFVTLIPINSPWQLQIGPPLKPSALPLEPRSRYWSSNSVDEMFPSSA
jgi:hypothetical protein